MQASKKARGIYPSVKMVQEHNILYKVGWYRELREIRRRLSVEEKHLKKIRAFMSKISNNTLSEVRDADFMEMYQTLLLSYPVLAKKHLEEWEGFREVCCRLFEADN